MSNVPHAAPRVNFASSMIVEDHLKKVLAKTEGKPWKFTDNKLLPRSQHSPFGDFPPEYMKPKAAGVEPVPHIEAAEQSIAAQGKSTLKKGEGLGGKTTSLLEPKAQPAP